MFLKRIEAQGFKSLAHKTIINFNDGLTVIVGPNGSGKSNINDAIKWVLGETSKKILRASSAKEMIFTGSDDEKEASFAEVSLFFDNKKRILDLEFDEIQITRKSYRHQDQNEYFINKELVRRKDVKNLFLDTGLGNTDLSIISQGSVTKITDAKPDDLKQLLEEAAGVSRYKKQKNEAVKKLDKVEQNFDLFNVKLEEMNKQVKPLLRQKEKAQKYLEIKRQLSKIELPLIKKQLTSAFIEKKELETTLFDTENEKQSTNVKSRLASQSIQTNQSKIIELEQTISLLQSKQTEMIQKSKTISHDSDDLTAEINQLAKSINEIKVMIRSSKANDADLNNNLNQLRNQEYDLKNNRDKTQYRLNQLEFELKKFLNKKTEYNYATKMILENKAIFNNVYGTVNDLVTFDKKYEKAINVAIGARLKNLVVDDEETIKDAISFLKQNRYGSATFMPAKKVVPKNISQEYLGAFSHLSGFISTLNQVIKYNKKFENVIKNLAGTILLFTNLASALKAAKQSGYKFQIVTLEGDIIYPGFIVKGGSINNKDDKLKTDFEQTRIQLSRTLKADNEKIINLENGIKNFKDNIYFLANEQIRLQERNNYFETNLAKLLAQYEAINGEKFQLEQFDSEVNFSDDLSPEQINNKIKSLQDQKTLLAKEILSFQHDQDELRLKWETSIEQNTNAKLRIEILRNEISTNVAILNKDYKLSFQALEEMKFIDVEVNISDIEQSQLQQNLRKEISQLGFINLDAIQEYEIIAKDYEILQSQTKDLKQAKEKLLSTIEQMDNLMKIKFEDTLNKVNEKFQLVFTKILGGGIARINYTDIEDKLNSGLTINAKTPGKKVQNLLLYSGGERSMIALSLIFAINEVNKLPLLMLDEVEAALDEANVERFASFSRELNRKTQLIITTHRLGTMEKADILYGVTMEKKGITKIVSVELREVMDLTDKG
ncbi:MAG: AAA family ATPase [Mycoplasmataceae bacterium]|nr:AAA family ATPase [Mycoplasmataceae bacterium]